MAKEVRLDIAGVTYREDSISSLTTNRQMFDGAPSVGNCICGQLDALLTIPTASIPRNAQLIPYIRNEGETVWKKKSVFFVFNRDTDEATGSLKIIAYDAIYKAEESFTQPGDQGYWPRTDIQIMTEIAQRTGTTVCADTRAIMTKRYAIQYPGIIMEDGTLKPDGEGALTMREVAGRVASMYAGNWIIDNNGEWRLVRLGDIPPETNYLITEDGDPIVLGRDRILVIEGLEEPNNLVSQNGDKLVIGGVRLLV